MHPPLVKLNEIEDYIFLKSANVAQKETSVSLGLGWVIHTFEGHIHMIHTFEGHIHI